MNISRSFDYCYANIVAVQYYCVRVRVYLHSKLPVRVRATVMQRALYRSATPYVPRTACRTCVCSPSESCNARVCKTHGLYIIMFRARWTVRRKPAAYRRRTGASSRSSENDRFEFFFFFYQPFAVKFGFPVLISRTTIRACRPRVHRDHNNSTLR